jgi:hypothetical protein
VLTGSGGSWTQVATSGPSARHNPFVRFDRVRGRVLLYGGTDPAKTCTGGVSEYCEDVWEWNGAQWTQVTGLTPPVGRGAGIMGYDPVSGGVLIHGGKNNSFMGDAWSWTPGKAKVRLIFEVDETKRQVSRTMLTGATVRVIAGGTGYKRGDEVNPGEAVDGVSVRAWDTTGGGAGTPSWVELATNATPAGNVTEVTADVGADVLHWWVGGKMYMGLTTKAPKGAGNSDPVLTVDYWEVKLKYALP